MLVVPVCGRRPIVGWHAAGVLLVCRFVVPTADAEAFRARAERDVVAPAPARTPRTLAAAGDLLRALAAPVRIAIVLQLRESPRCVHDLVDALGVTQPLISQHLRVLKAAGVVHGDRHGRVVVYALVDDHLAHIVVDAVEHAEEGR